MTLHKVAPGVVAEFENGMIRFYTPVGSFLMNEGEAQKMSRSLLFVIEGESAQERAVEEKMLETVVPIQDQITDAVTAEPEKKKRGRPRKNLAQLEAEAADTIQAATAEALAEMPRKVEPDAVAHLPGADIPVEVVEEANGEVVAVYANEAGDNGGVLVLQEAQIEKVVEPFNAELHETLKRRFPVGLRVRVFNVNGTEGHADGVLTKHFDGAHKCQVDLAKSTAVVDTREIADAPHHDADPEVIAKMQGGTYGEDYGQRWLGAPALLLDDVVKAASDLGVDDKEARLMMASLATQAGLVNTQVAAIQVALHFGEQVAQAKAQDEPLSPEELSEVRAEVKASGLTAAQAKELCVRHFGKDSAALLTKGEMQKFLGEILPTHVEMQGAEDF